MKLPTVLNVAYESSPFAERNRDELKRLRESFAHIDPAAYRGIRRNPLSEYAEPPPGWTHCADDVDADARSRFLDVLGPDHECEHYPCSLVPTLQVARELYRRVDNSAEYEIVRLWREDITDQSLLGYDVGYWGGGNCSAFCDCVIWPMWHPPPAEALGLVRAHVACVNAHMLFPDERSAERFRAFYVTQPWAETDSNGDFQVIGVAVVS